jgi:hypothetical protein
MENEGLASQEKQTCSTERSLRLGRIALPIILLPLIYFLSMGPAYMLYRHSMVSQSTVAAIYGPLGLLADNCRPIRGTLEWYLGLWEVH